MNFADAVDALNARTNYESTGRLVSPSLDRVRALAELLDNPQRSFPSIHVTGTNGKGTTVAVASGVLRALGLRVGAYTSPHLHSVRERIAYDLLPISEQDFADTYGYLSPFLETVDKEHGPVTWFEAVTAMSWVYFAERAVDVAVVEVGMGGTWDATNLIDGQVAVITKVALDHRELGSTTIEVAGEKSGIVKHGAVCLTAEADPAVLEVIRKKCTHEGATLRRFPGEIAFEERRVALGGQSLDVRVGSDVYDELFLPLFGVPLGVDATLGLAAASAFLGDRRLDIDAVRDAFATVKDPGRVEVIRRAPLVVVDGAHNADAASALAQTITESFTYTQLRLVLGMLGDHYDPAVLAPLLAISAEVVVCEPPSPRAMPAAALGDEIAAAGVACRVAASVGEACEIALSHAAKDEAVLVTGSLYTVAAARTYLLEE